MKLLLFMLMMMFTLIIIETEDITAVCIIRGTLTIICTTHVSTDAMDVIHIITDGTILGLALGVIPFISIRGITEVGIIVLIGTTALTGIMAEADTTMVFMTAITRL